MDARATAWLARDPDPSTRKELQQLLDAKDNVELEQRFAARLDFGTAGLRGLMGAGPGRMNRLVVRETSAGLGQYVLREIRNAKERGIVVGFDGRRGSRLFAEDTAGTLAGLGFKVFLAERDAPTPVCAFALRELRAAAAVVITASHNPADYNGYKVYWHNGAQIIPPHDAGIAAAIEAAAKAPLPWLDPAQARVEGRIVPLGERVEQRYLEGVAALSIHSKTPARAELVLAYTPLHGVGARFAEAALAQAGFTKVHSVKEQREPDGAFPTVRFPNPEEPGAMDLVLAMAKDKHAALALANDPDADRLAVAVRQSDGTYRQLTGNEVGALLGDDFLRRYPGATVATSIVSSRLLQRLAQARDGRYFETLTGFKSIANGALQREGRGERFVFGYEEALGYTIGSLVRDKDGISALVAICELAAELASRRETLLDRLAELYREQGLFLTEQKSLSTTGATPGNGLGDRLRAKLPTQLAGRAVLSTTDLRKGERRLANGTAERVELPTSDVLLFDLADGSRVIVRPSGTEPKVKCYYELRVELGAGESLAAADKRGRAQLHELITGHQAELQALS